MFGCGDSESCCDTFCDDIGILYESLKNAGWTFFSSSIAVVNGTFVGLILDEVNQNDKTTERINVWTAELKSRIQLLV